MDIIFHYPPELFNLLVDTIPLLNRSKRDVLTFFMGAGVEFKLTRDLWERVEQDRDSISKYEITRDVLTRLNSHGDATLRERREILKRITEFEDFSTCWPSDQLKAKGLVSEIRRVVNVKDSFTRINQEREKERQERIAEYQKKVAEVQEKKVGLEEVKQDFYRMFTQDDDLLSKREKQERGRKLETVFNRLFGFNDILVRESFTRIGDDGEGIVEQIDGVIELDGQIYLVEMKWLKGNLDINAVSRHLVRIYHRGYSRGIFISATEFSPGALEICTEALQKTVVVLCLLEELVLLLEREGDLKEFFKDKIEAAIVDKTPFRKL